MPTIQEIFGENPTPTPASTPTPGPNTPAPNGFLSPLEMQQMYNPGTYSSTVTNTPAHGGFYASGPAFASSWNDTPFQPPQLHPEEIYTNTLGVNLPQGTKVAYRAKDNEEYYNKKLSQIIGFKNGSQTGDIGLEIECEGTSLFNSPFQYWTCHQDGSLRETAGHAPIEYVLRAPLKLKELRSALEYLDIKLKEAGSKVVKSQRTSVHVHINVQKMTLRELFCFLCLYLIFEELLVDWSGPERAGNLFCLRAKDSDFYVNMLESVLKNSNFKQWREDYRYAACNVASVCKFGSLEFRSMQGTVDIQLIYLWVSLLCMLRDASQTYDNPVEIVEEFTNIGPLPFFKKIFKDKQYRQLFESVPGLSGKLWDGLRMMRDVAYCSEWNKKKENLESQDDQPPSDPNRVMAGDEIEIEDTLCIVEYINSSSVNQRWSVRDTVEGSSYSLEIPQGWVMYYTGNIDFEMEGDFLLLDLRPGPVEVR
jgi:hypothetical protein